MYCSKCGEQMAEDTKFCPKCGTQVAQQVTDVGNVESQQVPQQNTTEKTYTAPAPFQPYSSIDPNQGMVNKTAFKGKQVTAGSSGHVSFGKTKKDTSTGKKKKGCLTWLIRLIAVLFILFAILVVITMIEDDTAANLDIQTPIVTSVMMYAKI